MNSNHQDDSGGRSANPSYDEVQEARITAYALGQLGGQERADVEAELAASETARRTVEDIQGLAQQVRKAALATVVPPSEALRAALEARLVEATPPLPVMPAGDRQSTRRPLLSAHRRWQTWAAVAAAACVLLIGTARLYLGRGGPADLAVNGSGAPSQPSEQEQTPAGSGTSNTLAESSAAAPHELGKTPHDGLPTPGQSNVAANSARPGIGGVSDPGSTAKGRAPVPEELKSPGIASFTSPGSARVSGAPKPAPRHVAAEMPKGGASDRPTREEAGPSGIPLVAPAKSPAPTIASEGPAAPGAPSKALAGVARPRRSQMRHRPATDPGFLWPVGPIGPVYMSQSPPEIVAPLETEKPNAAKGATSPGPSGAFGKGGAAADAKGMANGKHAEAGAVHMALPPGMRPGSGKSANGSNGAKKGKGTAVDVAALEHPAPVDVVENDFLPADRFPYSTFPLEVDTGVYPVVERFLRAGYLPPADRVQIEDLINYFRYEDLQPKGDAPFSISVETAECPWARGHRLVRIAIVARRGLPNEPGAGLSRRDKAGLPDSIANDVRVQLEFNPAMAASYRLIGYDGPPIAAPKANEGLPTGVSVAPGQAVTALYEVIPAPPQPTKAVPMESHPPKSHRTPPRDPTAVDRSSELLTVRLRYQRPGATQYWLLECAGTDSGQSFAAASRDFQFAAAVAAFGMALRRSQFRGDITLEAVEQIADSARGDDPDGLRAGFVDLVRIARQLGAGR